MDSRVILSVMFMTLSWRFMGTFAQSSTMAPGTMTTLETNMTTPDSNMTHMTTMADTNMTSMTMPGTNMTNMTTPGTNMTNMNNMTTPGTDMTNMTTPGTDMTNMTTPGTNMTNMTTPGTNMTNMTTPGTNMTNMTTPGTNMTNMTTASTSETPTLSPNTTVVLLETNLSRTDCGTRQICAAEPAECDPSTSGSCFFIAAKQQSGRNFEFGLSGQSDGYIAASVSTSSSEGVNDTTYVCANNRGVVQFFGAFLNNGKLTETELPVNSVKGSVNGNQIQCTFLATLPDVATRTTATTFSLSVSTGDFNATSGTLGTANSRIRTSAVDLSNPNTTVENELSTTTTAVPMTSISRTGCSSEKLCAAEPSECDPSTSGSCFFFSAEQSSGQTFNFEVSGQSSGFIAASLSTDTTLGGNDDTFVCANNNGSVLFLRGVFNNGSLINSSMATVQNSSINGNTIQCAFTAQVANTTSTRAALFSIILSNGTFNISTQTVGQFMTRLLTNRVNLAEPNATITNLLNANTTSSPTTNHAVIQQQSLLQAMLVTLCVLALTMLGGN